MTIDESVEPISARMHVPTGATRGAIHLEAVQASPAALKADVLVVGAFADGTLSPPAAALDSASKGRLSALIRLGDLDDKPGSTLLLYDLPGLQAQRVLVISLGMPDELDDMAFREALAGAAKALGQGKAADAAVALADTDVPGRSQAMCSRFTVREPIIPITIRQSVSSRVLPSATCGCKIFWRAVWAR